MSDDNSTFDGEDEAAGFEPDPSTIAFLDQEAAAFAEVEAQFEATYGFSHKCTCDSDYASGKVVEVTECFAGMVVDSLETAARLNAENLALRQMLTMMFQMTGQEVGAVEGEVDESTEVASPEFFHGEIDGLTEDISPV